jgi:hypothetical protein
MEVGNRRYFGEVKRGERRQMGEDAPNWTEDNLALPSALPRPSFIKEFNHERK